MQVTKTLAAVVATVATAGLLLTGCGTQPRAACGDAGTACGQPAPLAAQPPASTTDSPAAAPITTPPPERTATPRTTRPPIQPVATQRAVPTTRVPGTPCTSIARACVDLSTHQAWLISNGRVVYGPVPALAGKPSAPTTPGTFHVLWKDKNHLSSEFNNAPMPYSVFFNSNGSAFHAGSLQVQSHGCVHLSTSAAARFFDFLSVGDVVQIVR